MTNLYKILGLSETDTILEIKKAFRSLAKNTHLDLNGGDTTRVNSFREIAEAYAILSNPDKKHAYDEFLNNTKKSKTNNKKYDFKYAEGKALDIANYIHIIREQARPYIKEAKFSIYVGLFWLILGLAVSYDSYSTAVSAGGGRYTVMYGAIIFGGIQFFRSLVIYDKIRMELKKIEKEMWENLGV